MQENGWTTRTYKTVARTWKWLRRAMFSSPAQGAALVTTIFIGGVAFVAEFRTLLLQTRFDEWVTSEPGAFFSLLLTVLIASIYYSQMQMEQEQYVPHIQVDQLRVDPDSRQDQFELELSNLGKGSARGLELVIEPLIEPEDFTREEVELLSRVEAELPDGRPQVLWEGSDVDAEPTVERLTTPVGVPDHDDDDSHRWVPALGSKLLPESGEVRFVSPARVVLSADGYPEPLSAAVSELPAPTADTGTGKYNYGAFRFRLHVRYHRTNDFAVFSLLPTAFCRLWETLGTWAGENDYQTVAVLDYLVPVATFSTLNEVMERGTSWNQFVDSPVETASDIHSEIQRQKV